MTTPSRTSTPPRTAERLLEALGAGPEFRDALLGDLAEEYATRTAYDGERAAGRWYWREALRVAPHLLRDWARHLRARDVARLAGVVGAAYLGVGAVVWGLLAAVEVVVERIAGPTTFPWHDPHPVALALLGLLLAQLGVAGMGGWVAARLDRRAPAVAALTLGVVSATLALLAPLPGRASLPAWYLLGQTVAILAGATLGGMRGIATRWLPRTRTP